LIFIHFQSVDYSPNGQHDGRRLGLAASSDIAVLPGEVWIRSFLKEILAAKCQIMGLPAPTTEPGHEASAESPAFQK
jgi:hypothetical protein